MNYEFMVYETDTLLARGLEEAHKGSLVFSGDSPVEAAERALRFALARNEKATLGLTKLCVYPDGFMGNECWIIKIGF